MFSDNCFSERLTDVAGYPGHPDPVGATRSRVVYAPVIVDIILAVCGGRFLYHLSTILLANPKQLGLTGQLPHSEGVLIKPSFLVKFLHNLSL